MKFGSVRIEKPAICRRAVAVPMKVISAASASLRVGSRRAGAGRCGIIALYPAMPEMHANRPGRFERGRFDARPARRLRDKVALGVGAGIAVGGVLPREPVLQRGVFIAAAGVGAQRVAEGQERLGLRVPVLDDVQMMGTGLRPWPQEQQPVVTARDLRPEQPACVSQHRHRSLRVR